ncbi:MAG: small multi-drug export protein [Desulfurococcaceae archaeon]|nr:small multi-drug export protein [Sulfolobales archaeon]MDW8170711.1 small multi-drug export protein [Desulfurococcaceae archaeon]
MNLVVLIILTLLALTPGLEVRASVPYGIVNGVNDLVNVALSYVASTSIAPIVIYGFNFVEKELVYGVKLLEKAYVMVVNRVRKRAEGIKASKWVYASLSLYVAVPLPLTGVWTGSLIAYLLDLRKAKSIIAIAIGNAAATLILYLSAKGVITLFTSIT